MILAGTEEQVQHVKHIEDDVHPWVCFIEGNEYPDLDEEVVSASDERQKRIYIYIYIHMYIFIYM